ncbi:MAG: ABC transporter ATP-binding protein [Burkholderiales bacterium]
MAAAIELRQVEKRFPNGVQALAGVDLNIENGEFTTLLGPSGCGKSTLLRLIAKLSAPSSGQIRLDESVERRRIAFVFQNATLMPWANVERNVRLPLELAGTGNADERAAHALAQVGLLDFRHAYPRELSGGMQMRVSIARALVTQPALLLMDEPFAALDEITRHRLDMDLRHLWEREKLTVLFVTHSIYEAVFLSNRVVVMSARPGRITGEEHIEMAAARNEEFRVTQQFAQYARRLSALLAKAPATERV